MKSKALLIKDGNFVELNTLGLVVKENSNQIDNFSINCVSEFQERSKIIILLDISKSNESNFSNIIKQNLIKFYENTIFSDFEITLIGFNQSNYLISPLTKDRILLKEQLNTIPFSGYTDIDAGFINPPNGIKQIINDNQLYNVILITDGSETGNYTKIINELQSRNIFVHSITLNYPTSKIVKNITLAKKGFDFNVDDNSEFEVAINSIAYFCKFGKYCEIIFNSKSCELDNILSLNFTNYSFSTNIFYSLLQNQLSGLIIEPTYHYFGIVNPPGIQNKIFNLKARNSDIRVNEFVNKSNFKVINPQTPFTLKKDSTINITVQFQPSDSSYIFDEIEIKGSQCSNDKIYLSGGTDKQNTVTKTLKVLSPNGGEFLPVGSNYFIEWSGVLPSDTVQIDYSTNSGDSWINLTNTASGLKYLWNGIPNTTSNNCLIRIKQLSKYDLAKNIISLNGIQGRVVNIIWKDWSNEIFTGSTDGFIRLWNTQNGEPLRTISGNIINLKNFTVSPDSKYFAYIVENSDNFTIRNIDNEFDEQIINIKNELLKFIEWNPVNNYLLTVSESGKLFIWDKPDTMPVLMKDFGKNISSVKWELSGDKIIIGFEDGMINIIDLNGSIEREFKVSDQKVISFDLNPTSKFIVSSSMNELIRIWDINSYDNIINFTNYTKPVYIVSWDPAAKYIISSSIDSTISIWSPGTGNLYYQFRGHNNIVNNLKWRKDGNVVASSTIQGEVFIWNTNDIPFNRPTLQEDLSDNLWSIINPNIEVKNVIFANTQFGRSKDTIISQIIKNNSKAELIIDTIFIRGASKSFSILNSLPKFPIKIDSEEYLGFKIRFTPFSVGNKTDTIVFKSGNREYRSVIAGFVSNQIIRITPNYHDFGTIKVGTNSEKLMIEIKNLSNENVFIENIEEVFNLDNQFEILDFNPGFIQPGNSYNFGIIFKSDSFFSSSACFDVNFDGKIEPELISLVGSGAAPQIQIPKSLDFEKIICQQTDQRIIKVYNKGNEKLKINSILLKNNIDSRFSLDLINTKLLINEHDSTEILIKFESNVPGIYLDTILIESEINADRTTFNKIPISAEKSIVDYKFSQLNVPYYIFDLNTPETKKIYVYNIGFESLEWEFPIDYQFFTIEKINPKITLPNDSSEVFIRFKGADKLGQYFQIHNFNDNCNINKEISLNAYIGPNLAEIVLPSSIIFDDIICQRDSIIKSIIIKNTGTTPLFISDYRFSNDLANFKILTELKGLSLNPNESVLVDVMFKPLNNGVINDTIIIISNAVNTIEGQTKIPLTGKFFNADFIVTPQSINLDNILENEKLHFILFIQNTGNIDLNWTNINNFNNFTIDSIQPVITKPGDISKVYLSFEGAKFGETVVDTLKFENICFSSNNVNIRLIINGSAKITLKVGNAKGKAGDVIEIPIQLYTNDGSNLPDYSGYTTTLSFNSTSLIPKDNNEGEVIAGKRLIKLNLPSKPIKSDSTVLELKFLATLGNEDSTKIEISGTKANGQSNIIRIYEIPGYFVMDKITTENGLRLIGNSGTLKLSQNMPNPVSEKSTIRFSTIENGNHKIILFDLNSNVSYLLFNKMIKPGDYEIEFNLNFLPSGNYIYKLETPTQQLIKKLTIVR